jgi:hypothetical protein
MKQIKFIYILLFLDLSIFSINILLLLKKNNSFIFKNNDIFLFNFNLKSFKNIFFLINKNKYYFSQKKKNPIQNSFNKKTINIFFEDCYFYQVNTILNTLQKKYIVNITNNNPDYLFYDVFGCNHTSQKYNNSIKIAFFTENQIPDFKIADYAFAQSHINYLDRYFLRPKLINRAKNNYFYKVNNRILNSTIKTKFCAAVISNYRSTDFFRLKFIKELNKYKQVDMGGKYLNNVGYISDKIKFLSSYKFSIAMENSEGDGYTSEKIIDSFLAGTIPIYYGNYMVDEFINPKSFILIRGEKDMIQKIEYIKKIDQDDELYRNILKEKIIINEDLNDTYIKEYEEFFFHIFDQEKFEAKRVDNYHFQNNKKNYSYN